MIRAIIAASLRHRVTVVALAVVAVLAAPAALHDVPLDVFPEFAPPRVEIQTEAPGLSTDEVESLVTIPIENALVGTSWVTQIQSKSVLGLSSVVLFFPHNLDVIRARQLVQERVARVAAILPAVVKPPVILSPLSSASRVLKIGLSSDSLSQIEMTTLAKWTIRPKLMAVPGVANVAIWGQRDRQLQVLVDPDRLHANGVSLAEVEEATRAATAIGGGGFVDTPNQRFAVVHRTPLTSAAELAQMVAEYRHGAPVTLGEVAVVTEGHQPPIGDAVINDRPGLLLVVEKQPWGNTVEVTRGVEAALEELAPALAGVEVDPTIFRPATFIEMALANLSKALLLGCLLVVLVLAAFLRDWRTGLISIVAIPLSLIAAALLLRWRGGTIDTMVLAGLVLALGEVVDDAIIDVENISRRLRLNRQLAAPRPMLEVVLNASLEVRSAVLFGSLLVILVFLPVFFLPGLAGVFFRPLALSYVLAIAASLVVALTISPALALLLLRTDGGETRETPLVHWLKARYRALLPRLVDRPVLAIRTLTASLGIAAVAYVGLGEEFLPRFREYDFLMHWIEKPGISIEAMARITQRVSRELRAIPGVRNFGSHIGRAEVADEVVGPNFTELWISVDPAVNYEGTVERIQEVVDGYPGIYRDVLTHLRERIKEVLSGEGATVVVRVSGPSLETLRHQAELIRDSIAGIRGVIDLKVQAQTLVPQIQIRYRPEAAARFGVTPEQVQHTVSTLVRGAKVGEFYEDQKSFDVVVWGVPTVRQDPSSLSRLLLDTPAGPGVPLGAVADVALMPALNEITREAATRKLDVTCNVAGRDLGGVARDIEAVLARLPFPAEHHASILGEYAERKAAESRLLALSAIALVGILLLLYTDFGSLRLTLLVAVSLPFALIGGVAAVWVTGGVLSLGSLVGFVTVLGIAGRNGIMLVSHLRHLEEQEGVPFGRDLVLRGADERLVPIVMTASVTALALVPIILGGARPGHEIEHPMAVVIVGGLVTSTILNLFLMPALYLRYGRRGR
ncbi:MAG: efflux RND transporter permease subunit [Gemmatimonadota bacterium]|nr:efflux RND transporter permease subunit [Gemmatimonadota bacterium]MDH5282257.1 efflux RND transporter permease subunit [Gemmatimonadota bacterium]